MNAQRQIYSALRQQGLLTGTIKAALAKREQREQRQQREPDCGRLALIPLGPRHAAAVAEAAGAQFPRRKNWDYPESSLSRHPGGIGIQTINHGQYSSQCYYDRISYAPIMRSCGSVTAGRALILVGEDTIRLRSPRGWRFGRDVHGLYLVRLRETREAFRYHPTSDEWVSGLAAIRAAAIAHEQTQRRVARDHRATLRRERDDAVAARRQARQDAALLATVPVYVCLRDSRRAGNCAAGTAAWARRHGLDARQHVPAALIRKLAKRNRQALRVVEFAERRTLDELHRGYSLISDHRQEVTQ